MLLAEQETTGVTSGAGTAFPFRNIGVSEVSVAQSLVCRVLLTLFVFLSLFFL